MTRRVSTLVLMFVLCGAVAAAAQGPDGAALFEAQCARCHTEPGVQLSLIHISEPTRPY